MECFLGIFGIFARDLIAKSGNNKESLTLINHEGCPQDLFIFPSLQRIPGSKSLQGKFEAFKFSDDPVVKFQVNVQFCLEECPPVSNTKIALGIMK